MSPRRRWRGWRASSPACPSPPTRAGRGLRGCSLYGSLRSGRWAQFRCDIQFGHVFTGVRVLLTLSRVCLCDCVCVTVWCVCACVCVSLSGGGGRAPLPVFIRRDSKQLTINQKSLCRGAILLAFFARGPRARPPSLSLGPRQWLLARRGRGGAGSTTDAFPMKTLKRQPRPSVPPAVRPWCSARAPLAPP